MTQRTTIYVACLLAFLTLTGFEVQTATYEQSFEMELQSEREAQAALPQAKDALWQTLLKTKISVDTTKGLYSAKFSEDIKKLNGQKIKVSGFIVPLEPTITFKHFLLSKKTAVCPFCPPGEPNEVIEVFATKPEKWQDNLVVYEGQFELVNNREQGIFFRLNNAHKK
jgi:uncharacterized protein